MATVTIRNLDDSVVKSLKERAKAHSRSLEAELRHLLTQSAAQYRRMTALRREARRIAAMTPDVPQTDSTKIIRGLRDR